MQDTLNGIIPFIILMTLAFAASRVLARATGNKYSRALTPLAPLINGTFATDSLSHGGLEGTYGGRKVGAASTPNVNELGGLISPNNTGAAHRYNAFDVEVQNVAGERDWELTWGLHSMGQILSREQSWKWSADDDLKARLQSSGIIAELESFAGAGVRGQPTVIYNARRKTLTHRDNVSPDIAPSAAQFQKQLDLALCLAHLSEQINHA
ncbi:MAG TPA: hypothetical protein VF627_10425 [Abditibacterium sp.]